MNTEVPHPTMLPWPDLSLLRMTVVPITGFQPGNALVLEDGLGLPELAEALGFKPYKGRHVLRRGVTDPGFAASGAALAGAVAYLLPQVGFRQVDPVSLACRSPDAIPEAARAVADAIANAPPAEPPPPAQADAGATHRFVSLPKATPGSMLADACTFARPDPFSLVALRGEERGSFAFLLSPAFAAVGSHDRNSAEVRVTPVDGSAPIRLWLSKTVSGPAVTFAVGDESGTRTYASRILAARHLRESLMRSCGIRPRNPARDGL